MMTTWPRSWSISTTRTCRAKSDPRKKNRARVIFPLHDARLFPIFPLHAATDRRERPGFQGAIAQLGERYNGIVEVMSSILIGSTNKKARRRRVGPFCLERARPREELIGSARC